MLKVEPRTLSFTPFPRLPRNSVSGIPMAVILTTTTRTEVKLPNKQDSSISTMSLILANAPGIPVTVQCSSGKFVAEMVTSHGWSTVKQLEESSNRSNDSYTPSRVMGHISTMKSYSAGGSKCSIMCPLEDGNMWKWTPRATAKMADWMNGPSE